MTNNSRATQAPSLIPATALGFLWSGSAGGRCRLRAPPQSVALQQSDDDSHGCSRTGLYPIGEISPKGYSHHVSVAIDICTRLGRRIRRLRQQRGWTQTYLAEHTGLGRAFISNLENGRKEACLRSLEILAIGFDMPLSQLFRDL